MTYGTVKTYLPSNLAKIVCPLFGAEVEIRSCLILRDQVWHGERPPVRQGCQACMRASKCPIVPMVQNISRTGNDPGYYSAEPRTLHFSPDLLRKIAAVIVPDAILKLFDIPPRQRELILETNGLLGAKKFKGGVDLGELHDPTEHKPKTKAVKHVEAPKPEADAVVIAAVTGDLSAAINIANAA